MNRPEIAIGSRGSPLALAQASLVRDAFERVGWTSRIVIVETQGDRRAPDTAWGEGAFVAAIERELLAGRVDVAVHSAKDLPTDEDSRLRIAACLPRADPRDALVVRTNAAERCLADLAPGSRVGTDSPRRTGFLLARRPDLAVHALHGNVDTRLRRLDAGDTDALVLACAGLDRMGLGDQIAERLEPEVVPPAPGQGAIAIQIRREDLRMFDLIAEIDDRPTHEAVDAERVFLGASGGGCRAPIGALATIVGDDLDLLGGWARPDGSETAIAHRRGPRSHGRALARELASELGSGARRRGPIGGEEPIGTGSMARRVLVTRAAGQADRLVSALRDAGLRPVAVPAIAVEIDSPRGDLTFHAGLLHTYRWVVVTSANGAWAILDAAARVETELEGPSWAAIGAATARVLEHRGIQVAFQPSKGSGLTMALELPVEEGDRILVLRGDRADGELPLTLRRRGAEVHDVVAYRTLEAPESSRGLLRAAMAEGPIAAVVFTSGSTVRGLISLGHAESIDVRSLPAVCIGPETAGEARAAGFRILAVSPAPNAAALAAATAAAIARQPKETS